MVIDGRCPWGSARRTQLKGVTIMKISKTRLENMTYERRWKRLIRGCNRELLKKFTAFHAANRYVFVELMRIAEEQWDADWRSSSVWFILNIIRRSPEATVDTDSKYKIDNNYFAYYARLLIARQPKFANWIEIKSFKGQRNDSMEDHD